MCKGLLGQPWLDDGDGGDGDNNRYLMVVELVTWKVSSHPHDPQWRSSFPR